MTPFSANESARISIITWVIILIHYIWYFLRCIRCLFSLYSVLASSYSVRTLFGVIFIITGANAIIFGAFFLIIIFGAKAIIFGTSFRLLLHYIRCLPHYTRCFLRYERHLSLQGAVQFGGSLEKKPGRQFYPSRLFHRKMEDRSLLHAPNPSCSNGR